MKQSEMIKSQLDSIKAKLMEKASTQAKKEVAEKIASDLEYAVRHMDEGEYGVVFVRNIMVAMQLAKPGTSYTRLGNAIVRNTQRVLLSEIKSLVRGRKVEDTECTDKADTLLPGSRWYYMGWCVYLRRCVHDITVHFKCGKHGAMPTFDEMARELKEIIDEAEEAA